ncbi:MAG: glutamate synthase [Oscillospiraceae bacterium]|nr:glutamate synthase [Oscillospiraceae bacterium]
MKIDASNIGYSELNKVIRESGESRFEIENVLGQRYIGAGSSDKEILISGTPGNALGAYLNGSKIIVHGNAQDAIGDTMNDGAIIVHGNCGDTTGYAMRSGEIYVEKNAGYRVGIHMKSYKEQYPIIVIGGKVGDFLGEYQAGGIIIVLGIGVEGCPVGSFCGTGMHGGEMFIRSESAPEGLPSQVCCTEATAEEKEQIRRYIDRFVKHFGNNTDEFLKSRFYKLIPNSANPYKQLYVNN